MYLDELARHGLVGLILVTAMLGLGAAIAFRAALSGSAGPLAIISAYLVLNLTEPRNDWIHPSVTGFVFLLSVLAASAWNTEKDQGLNMGAIDSEDQVAGAEPRQRLV